MTAHIIEFTSRLQAKPSRGIPPQLFEPPSSIPSTGAGRNKRLRAERGEAWRKAGAATGYWRMMMDFYDAVYIAQREGVAEACRDHPRVVDFHCRQLAVARFHEATVAQLLTPAPLVAAVNWKRKAFARGDHRFTHVTAEQIEASIKSDVAWLTAHPARQPGPH